MFNVYESSWTFSTSSTCESSVFHRSSFWRVSTIHSPCWMRDTKTSLALRHRFDRSSITVLRDQHRPGCSNWLSTPCRYLLMSGVQDCPLYVSTLAEQRINLGSLGDRFLFYAELFKEGLLHLLARNCIVNVCRNDLVKFKVGISLFSIRFH